MVNARQAVNKLPSLLVHSKTTNKRGHNEYKRLERGLQRFKHKNPEEYDNAINLIFSGLEILEKGANNSKNF